MPEVIIKKDESIDKALRRFKIECQKAGIKEEIMKHQFYEKPSEKKKRKLILAKMREIQRLREERRAARYEKKPM